MALNGKERKKLQEMAEHIKGVGARAAEMRPETGYVSYHQEATRLMDSADYRKGYYYCRDHVYAYLKDLGIKIPEDPT